jgi:hypothetical protein
MRINTRLNGTVPRTHEGAAAIPPKSPIAELRRAVMSCLLWEDQFYEDGVKIADRISALCAKVDPLDLAALAVEARIVGKLRHIPLLLLVELMKHGTRPSTHKVIYSVVQRADEMGELLALYWKDGKRPIPAAMKRGLAEAFKRFDAYQLGKYNRDGAVKLRDILRLVHPKPDTPEQAALWKSVIDGTLKAPDTWEVALSGGADKKATFERLISEGKLGYLALLRNLRNMIGANVDLGLVRNAILARKGAHNVLPFRFTAAARHAPMLEPALDEALCAQIEHLPVLLGRTVVLVDVSGSMDAPLSGKSDLTRMDAAATLASIINGERRVFAFSEALRECPPRHGMAGIDAIKAALPHGGTLLGKAVAWINANVPYERIIVITDEQSAQPVPPPKGKGYMINVASYRNGIGYGPWVRIDGFSENVLSFIGQFEAGE